MLGYDSFPPLLRRYLIAVSIVGLAMAIALAIAGGGGWTERELLYAALVTIVAALAERFSLHLTHHTHVSVNTAVYVAMMLIVPWSWIGVLTLIAVSVAKIQRRQNPGLFDLPEILFNVG